METSRTCQTLCSSLVSILALSRSTLIALTAHMSCHGSRNRLSSRSRRLSTNARTLLRCSDRFVSPGLWLATALPLLLLLLRGRWLRLWWLLAFRWPSAWGLASGSPPTSVLIPLLWWTDTAARPAPAAASLPSRGTGSSAAWAREIFDARIGATSCPRHSIPRRPQKTMGKKGTQHRHSTVSTVTAHAQAQQCQQDTGKREREREREGGGGMHGQGREGRVFFSLPAHGHCRTQGCPPLPTRKVLPRL